MLETTVYKKTSEGRLDWVLSSDVGNMLWLETYVVRFNRPATRSTIPPLQKGLFNSTF